MKTTLVLLMLLVPAAVAFAPTAAAHQCERDDVECIAACLVHVVTRQHACIIEAAPLAALP